MREKQAPHGGQAELGVIMLIRRLPWCCEQPRLLSGVRLLLLEMGGSAEGALYTAEQWRCSSTPPSKSSQRDVDAT